VDAGGALDRHRKLGRIGEEVVGGGFLDHADALAREIGKPLGLRIHRAADDLVLRRVVRRPPCEPAREIEVAPERRGRQVRLALAQQAVDLRRVVGEHEGRLHLQLLREQRREVVLEAGRKALRILEVGRRAVHGENDQLAGLRERCDGPGALVACAREAGEERDDATPAHGSTV
jgi:hypothetical protein